MKIINKVDNFKLPISSCIRDGLKQMDKGGIGFLYIVDENNKVKGIITDGDLRRTILNGNNLNEDITVALNKTFISLSYPYQEDDVFKIFDNSKVRHIPVFKDEEIFQIITSFNVPQESESIKLLKNYPVVIMAGGMGTRMKPFTHILPKPLVPFGEKSILEVIMDKYKSYGVEEFYVTVNFKKSLIKAYLEDKPEYNVTYIEENMPLGTAGSLKLLPNEINTPFFVSNCDIIIKGDYSEIVDFHNNGKYDLTLIASVQHMKVPYGVCTINDGGELKEIIEKPSYDFLVNTGMYLLNPSVLKHIPEATFYHITHLMEDLKKAGKKVGVFPVSERSWIDVGQWEEYIEQVDKINKGL